jgi:hypothetical protein
MDTTAFFSLLLGVLIVLYILIRLTAPFRQQESTDEARWCYGCNAWMRDVEQYWYNEGTTRVMSYLCPDCTFERKAIAVDEDGFPLEPLL